MEAKFSLEKSCQVSSSNSKTSSSEKEDFVNKGTIHLATSIKLSRVFIFSMSTCGQTSGINKPPSAAKPCIRTSSNVLLWSIPLVLWNNIIS